MASAIFPVQRPGHRRVAVEGDVAGLEGTDLFVGGPGKQGGDDGVELGQGGGGLHQQHLKLAVIQDHIVVLHPLETAHGDGVGDHTIDKVAFLHHAVMLDGHGVAGDVGQALDAFQYVGRVSQNLLDLLRGLIGHIGEQAKGGHVDKDVVVVELTHVAGEGFACRCDGCGFLQVGGEAEGLGKIIGAAGGEIPQRLLETAVDHAGDHLAEGAVTAGTDDAVIGAAQLLDGVHGVSGRFGGVQGDQPVFLLKQSGHFS